MVLCFLICGFVLFIGVVVIVIGMLLLFVMVFFELVDVGVMLELVVVL